MNLELPNLSNNQLKKLSNTLDDNWATWKPAVKSRGIFRVLKQNFLEEEAMKLQLEANDKIAGRPIRLNRQKLALRDGKNYAEVVFFGDWHYGSPQSDNDRALRMLDYCHKKKIYVFLMGDLLEMATRDSIGGGVYEQEKIGQSQYESMLEYLRPLANAKLILGMLTGNHEERVYYATGVNVTKAMARELKIPYLADACWNEFTVGSQKYSVYSLHGRTSARFDGTSLQMVERVSHSFNADLVACGHAHKCVNGSILVQQVVNGRIKESKKFIMITGSYLSYDGGYYSKLGGQISKMGSPKVKFQADEHGLNISW
jgi:hypothetical protein